VSREIKSNSLVNLIRFFMMFYQTKNKMTLSWKELVCHGLLKKVGDPSLVKDLLKMIMKGRFSFLEEEARGFHSRSVGPVVDVYRDEWRYWGHRQPSDQCLHAIAGYEERHARLRRSAASRAELWLTAIRYKNVKKELRSSWEERMPRKRKDSILIAVGAGEKGWEPEDGLLDLLSDDGVLLREQKYIAKCQWYQGIHEGRYYLFWHKDSFRAAAHCSDGLSCSPPSERDIRKASIDINVIEEKKHIDDMFIKD